MPGPNLTLERSRLDPSVECHEVIHKAITENIYATHWNDGLGEYSKSVSAVRSESSSTDTRADPKNVPDGFLAR
jgi:hypothetical protein